MRRAITIITLIIFSCKSLSETERRHEAISGKWLIIGPDHRLKAGQEIPYSHIQDSIVSLKGLKLVSFENNGVFTQPDSVNKKGRWGMATDNVVFIEGGGQGFDNFNTRFTDYKDGLLRLTEFVETGGEKIELIWNLRKVTGKYISKLFDNERNHWRIRPARPESQEQMRGRLADMLHYYSDYYGLVTREADFFIPARVILPFKFYRHAMAMQPFDEQSFFAGLFYDKGQAKLAWQQLKLMMTSLRDHFPRKEDFLQEYSEFMADMAEAIVKD